MLSIDLEGKTAIVTGAGQGLGEAIATRLHEAGANVAINYFSDPEGVNRAKAEERVTALGDRAVALEADVRDLSAVQAMTKAAAERFGGLDILINNAGVLQDRTLKKMTPEEWQCVLDTNLTGVFNGMRAAVDVLNEGGRIVNISSISAIMGFYGQSNYAAAKAGVIGLTKAASRELAGRAITVNAVAPGVVMTEMGQSIPEAVRNDMFKSIPLKRFGEPREIADVIVFLCSRMASYMTGQVLHVNGGWIG
ncbi:MAG: SDR family oxidoreductase [Nitrospiraceae bacterium]|nr:SDR family oxidoreductase [Nitrospiraceae bacterium]